MLTIHDHKGFPNPLRVRIAVAKKKLDDRVRYVSINVPNGERRGAAFLAGNPAGPVPAPELEDGAFLGACAVIAD